MDKSVILAKSEAQTHGYKHTYQHPRKAPDETKRQRASSVYSQSLTKQRLRQLKIEFKKKYKLLSKCIVRYKQFSLKNKVTF